MSDYDAPVFRKEDFNCPFCGVNAHQWWFQAQKQHQAQDPLGEQPKTVIHHHCGTTKWTSITNLWVAMCNRCKDYSYWISDDGGSGEMVYPDVSVGPPPHEDMPEKIKSYYEQARSILIKSPPAAAALTRLTLDILVKDMVVALDKKDERFFKNIGILVKEYGLGEGVQKALDGIRVIGGDMLHPNVLNMEDTKENAENLLGVVNFIVQELVTRKKQIDALNDKLTPGQQKAIEKRDSES